jgi:putative addiction module component (TIGR02574 family)
MHISDIPEITHLSIPEKILLAEELWDSIASEESRISVPQSHLDELDRRQKNHQSAPGNLLSLEELQSKIEGRK